MDQAETWTQLSASDRKAAKKAYSDAGVSVIVSLFGSTDAPTTKNEDPTEMANTVAAFVKQYDLDGVDGASLSPLISWTICVDWKTKSITKTSLHSITARRWIG